MFIAVLSFLMFYEEKQKIAIRSKYKQDGDKMKVFYDTRLGKWSPK